MDRRLMLAVALAVAGCSFDSSGLRGDGRRSDGRQADRPAPADSAIDPVLPADVSQPPEVKPASDAQGPDKPAPPTCSRWSDWKCTADIYGVCTATCNDGKKARTLVCHLTYCTCSTTLVPCQPYGSWNCPRCEIAVNDGCCRP